MNEAAEGQISALDSHSPRRIAAHFLRLRRQEVRLSDTESIVYGLIFLVLLSMLAFNIWFAATRLGGSPGTIFSVIAYSQEFLQSAVQLPVALQALTRLREITERISRLPESDNSA
ncbi:MAG: ABC transporter six-transmembrane domain-containing protein [Paracoccus sp. (in: a-proteobacteria)]|nr:ABC transporter six-transmembrane domain-containing protein [Paracoccus sp. (in: a-proteobacteria)]MDO5630649.1 ABC transporter six-transmembrane domain-containing protein [Paracoccus sp. (in: a-proteobacteria)]